MGTEQYDPWYIEPYVLMDSKSYIPLEVTPASVWIPINNEMRDCPCQSPILDTTEYYKISKVNKRSFEFYKEVRGELVNILEGLELYTRVILEKDEQSILDCIFNLRDRGRAGLLKERTYSEPRKWMRGKGRITIQCGYCYNFTNDRQGNPPGILRYDQVDLLPPMVKWMIKQMVRWNILLFDCITDNCIINPYDEGDYIPPHIDHHDFVRPFCTVSFMSESNILFEKEIHVLSPREFKGSVEIPLPIGSVLVLKGNGTDVVKHCIPKVQRRRVSVIFRRMDNNKILFGFQPDSELEELLPYEL
ncbi:uncharacterized protein LOC110032698 [Phalaenopsis equestris]|uniref:uncharacterized protein LOC110032698 n=1 Tax=Phalaenopsis equestris TaxID=78828 RepID=UPI0009E43E34|nr:uncharacterized protein LOC110032698 [Phalaenopsis equestris]